MCVVVILVDGLPPRDFWKGVELAPPKKWFHLCSFISHIVLFTSDPILPSWTCIKLFLLLHTFIYYWYNNQTTNSFSPPKIFFGPHIHPTHPPQKKTLLNRIRNCRSKILKAPYVSCCKTRNSPRSQSRWPPTPLDPAILRHPRETRRAMCPKHEHLCHPGWQQQPWDHHLK